jgi:hypothetical protein
MVDDLVGRGVPVAVQPGDIEVEGSLLFEDGLNEQAFTIQVAKK